MSGLMRNLAAKAIEDHLIEIGKHDLGPDALIGAIVEAMTVAEKFDIAGADRREAVIAAFDHIIERSNISEATKNTMRALVPTTIDVAIDLTKNKYDINKKIDCSRCVLL